MKDSRGGAETRSGEPHGMRYEKYKQTGIPWLPEVPEGWEYSIVGRCFDIQLGKMLCSSQPTEEYTLESYYCAANVHFEGVQTSDLKQMWFDAFEKSRYLVRNGDLLVVEGGAGAGGSAIVRQQISSTYMQNSILRLRSRSRVGNVYLCYWLESIVKRGYIEMSCNKATIPHFTKAKISQVPIPYPGISTQRAIVAYLDDKCGKIDELVAAKEKEVELLKELKQTVIADAVTRG
ncbi:MAG: restriction endonuclease subunit S, partial [bacterium]|nr:restriction endonuclease subunit S [bacterium]